MRSQAVAALAMIVIARSAAGQAVVTRIVGADGAAVDSTTAVSVIAFGSVRAANLRRNARISVGDELRWNRGQPIVVLLCPDSAEVTLEGSFRVVLSPGKPKQSCFLDVHSGKVHVMGDTTTGLGLGDVTLGAKRTRYAVTVTRTRDTLRRDVEVFDGEVEVEGAAVPRAITVRAGRWLAVARTTEPQPITPDRVQAAASVYARTDLSRLNRDRREGAVEGLTARYADVLGNPDRPEPRLRLIDQQVRLGVTGNATIYEINRIRGTRVPGSDIEPATEALALAAYRQLGRDELVINQQLTALQRFDSPTIDRVLQKYGINPDVFRNAGRLVERPITPVRPDNRPGLAFVRDTLVVTVTAQPADLRLGRSTTITVSVTNRAGAVADASVTLDVEGGTFRAGSTSITGVTNSDGVFTTPWNCVACAQSIGARVRVTKEGMSTSQQTLQVRIPQ